MNSSESSEFSALDSLETDPSSSSSDSIKVVLPRLAETTFLADTREEGNFLFGMIKSRVSENFQY